MKRLFALLFSMMVLTTPVRADVQTLLQLVDYLGVDYPAAVENGEVLSEFEYAEMTEFAGRIRDDISQLGASDATAQLTTLANELAQGVDNKVNAGEIAALTQSMRQLLMSGYDLVLTPRAIPDLTRAQQFYETSCASCHGEQGYGDGLASVGMEPTPTNFHDLERAAQRSLFGLYNTITLGVAGTAMGPTAGLDDTDRWSLAFYVGSLVNADGAMDEAGAAAWDEQAINLNDAVTLSPAELGQLRPVGQTLAFWTRTNPAKLFEGRSGPMQIARELLATSLDTYLKGDRDAALQQAVSAYLEGYELLEAPLSNVDAGLMRRAETGMINYRQAISKGADADTVQQRYDEIIGLLNEADIVLSGDALSPSVAFSGSLIILLREGLEIILVLAAIITFLVRSGRSDALKYVHAGWIIALIAGVATWAVSAYLFTISGATRELTEGYTALFAAGILLYVGFWMHRNASSQRWNQYLTSQVKTALTARTLWTLVLVSFLAVYREIFEIILFYQALWAQVTTEAHNSVLYGAALAVAILGLVTFAIYRFGIRLPIKQFFSSTAILLVVLAFIFTGKGIAALQEAGSLSINRVPGPTIDLLGIYPNVQVLLMQALVVILTVGVFIYDKRAREAE